MPGAPDGDRAIDFGLYIASPSAGMLLADQGTDAHEILMEIGLGHRFDQLAQQGVVRLEGVGAE